MVAFVSFPVKILPPWLIASCRGAAMEQRWGDTHRNTALQGFHCRDIIDVLTSRAQTILHGDGEVSFCFNIILLIISL